MNVNWISFLFFGWNQHFKDITLSFMKLELVYLFFFWHLIDQQLIIKLKIIERSHHNETVAALCSLTFTVPDIFPSGRWFWTGDLPLSSLASWLPLLNQIRLPRGGSFLAFSWFSSHCAKIFSGSRDSYKAELMFWLDFSGGSTSGFGGDWLWCSHDAVLSSLHGMKSRTCGAPDVTAQKNKLILDHSTADGLSRSRLSVLSHFLFYTASFVFLHIYADKRNLSSITNTHKLNSKWRWMLTSTLKRTSPTETSKNWRGGERRHLWSSLVSDI